MPILYLSHFSHAHMFHAISISFPWILMEFCLNLPEHLLHHRRIGHFTCPFICLQYVVPHQHTSFASSTILRCRHLSFSHTTSCLVGLPTRIPSGSRDYQGEYTPFNTGHPVLKGVLLPFSYPQNVFLLVCRSLDIHRTSS